MNCLKPLETALNMSLFAEIPDTPFSVFFGKEASVTRLYPYLEDHRMYTVIDYWMNSSGEIMIRFDGFNHYFKFVEGGMYICHLIKPN
jgi:hypothetical protein